MLLLWHDAFCLHSCLCVADRLDSIPITKRRCRVEFEFNFCLTPSAMSISRTRKTRKLMRVGNWDLLSSTGHQFFTIIWSYSIFQSSNNLLPMEFYGYMSIHVSRQGDTSCCFQPPIDMETKVAF